MKKPKKKPLTEPVAQTPSRRSKILQERNKHLRAINACELRRQLYLDLLAFLNSANQYNWWEYGCNFETKASNRANTLIIIYEHGRVLLNYYDDAFWLPPFNEYDNALIFASTLDCSDLQLMELSLELVDYHLPLLEMELFWAKEKKNLFPY